MKKFKFLLVLAMIIATLTTVVMAEAGSSADSAVIKGANGYVITHDGESELTIEVIANINAFGDSSTVTVSHTGPWKVKSITGGTLTTTNKNAQNKGWASAQDFSNIVEYKKGDVLCTVVYEKDTESQSTDALSFGLSAYWYDAGDMDGNGSYDPVQTTTTYTTAPASEPEPAVPAVIVSKSEGRDVIVGKDHTYGGIWIGKYVVNANDETISGIKLDFSQMEANKIKTYSFPTAVVKGNGNVNCNIAIVGVPSENYTAPVVTLVK